MEIVKGTEIAGFPILKIRNFLRKYSGINIKNLKYISHNLKISEPETKKLVLKLTKLGYLKVLKNDLLYTHSLSVKGAALANAKALPPIKREKAEIIFKEFMNRVKEVNRNSYYLFKVDKVILFGSFLADVPFVNDIDLAIRLSTKIKNPDIRDLRENEKRYEAIKKGVKFNGIMAGIFYPVKEVERFLIGKSRYISLHDTSDLILKETKTKVVYPSTKKRKAA